MDVTATGSTARRASGNLTEVSFALPMEIPAGGLVNLRPALTRVDPSQWATDFEPYTVAVAPAEGSADAVAVNNSVSTKARYYSTSDPELTATWRVHNLVTQDGEKLPINVQDTLTITANSPGDVPTDSSLTIGGPSVYDGTEYVDVFEDVRIVSAMLNGQDVADTFVKQPSTGMDDRVEWRIGVVIPAGQKLVVDVDVDVATSTREYVYSGAWTQFHSSKDRDDSNNRADTGPTP